jgi:polyferredoxin
VAERVSRKTTARHSARGWILARKVVQGLSLVLFVLLFIYSPRGGWPEQLVNLPMRLDPLLVISHLLSSKVFLAGSLVALLLVGLTLVFGRAWCGWLCPLGTILDLFDLKKWRGKRNPPPEAWRGVKNFLLLVILVAAILGNLSLLVLDPLTILYRTLTTAIFPALDVGITVLESALYRLPFLSDAVASFDALVRPVILPPQPAVYGAGFLVAGIFVGSILLNIFAQRFWCRYLCPLGGLLGLLSKVALFRRQAGEDCKGCALCEKVCPTGTIDPQQDFASDPAECTMCLDCLDTCPRSTIAFAPHKKADLAPAQWQPYDIDRRKFLLAAGASLGGVALLLSTPSKVRAHNFLIRPPGVSEDEFLDRCVRCAECVRACPTGGLQPAITEAGLEGFWTPVLAPRLGYCDYSCNACGQICPVQAIPPLELDEKRLQVIGKATIDQNRCIAWSDHVDCIICEEMCPLPEKAIELKQSEWTYQDGSQVSVKVPYVLRERCIGCGICEYQCPVAGDAAIRVYTAMPE